jgi:hypothetical protein
MSAPRGNPHGRIPSLSGVQPISPQGRSIAPGHRPIPTVAVAHNRQPTELQSWNGRSMTPFLRWAYAVRDDRGREHPNYNFNADVDNAIRVSETIVSFSHIWGSGVTILTSTGRL